MTHSDLTGAPEDIRIVGYAYPWDVLGDPDFVTRTRALGISRVAVATAYHTVRAATPLHPQHRLVEARSAALYRPLRPEAWGQRRLVPATPYWLGEEDPAGRAAAILTEAGLEVAAWIVLTHSSRLGLAHPALSVVNCFGEPYPYALCPQNPEVREYAATLAAESVRDLPCSAVILEACGQLGLTHGGHHEKTDGAYDARTEQLLSICCCPACRRSWEERGLDPVRVLADLRTATTPGADIGATPVADRPAALSEEVLATILASRHAATDALRREVIDAVRSAAAGPVEIVLHAQPDPWVTGANPGLTDTAVDDVDVVVSQCWSPGDSSNRTAAALSAAVAGRAVPAAYVTVLPPTTADDFGPHLEALTAAGIVELHLYHLGLANQQRQRLLAEAAGVGQRGRKP